MQVGKQLLDRDVYRVIGCASIVGSPHNPSIRLHQHEGMSVPAGSHHPILIGHIGLRDGEIWIGEHRDAKSFIAHFLL
ncbi:hypothetical protein [Dictyobacter formicarum]|uniref:hypothetical protein n=1 Tax=Dictyobacter formicarum TaxID=2778368 RepID=UPI001915EF4B|nr:hypothetical protein [Dictyobacter formicarum]